MTDLTSESRELLLVKLFDLMEQSESINILPAERKERIKEKYRKAPIDRIIGGIKMLEDDIAKKKEIKVKAEQVLNKNIQEQKEIKKQEAQERMDDEKRAKEILNELERI